MLKRTILIGSVTLLTALALACGNNDNDDSATPVDGGDGTTVEVAASDFAFSPNAIEAEPGDEISVVLTNSGGVEHSFTIDDGVIDIEAEGGGEATGTFTAPDAEAEFYCKYHPTQMRGTISVSGDSSSGSGGGGVGY